jgi:hypothetical protein
MIDWIFVNVFLEWPPIKGFRFSTKDKEVKGLIQESQDLFIKHKCQIGAKVVYNHGISLKFQKLTS